MSRAAGQHQRVRGRVITRTCTERRLTAPATSAISGATTFESGDLMTITAVPPQRPLVAGETSSEVTSPLLLSTAGTAGTAAAVGTPPVFASASGHRAVRVPRSRPGWLVPVMAAVVVAALVSTGVGAYLLGAHASDRAASAVPVPGPAPASSPAPVDGPGLIDAGGAPVDAVVAEHVRAVFTALQSADFAAVKSSYSASGSDDWFTVKPKLDRVPVRAGLLGALRAAPSHRGVEYRYRSAGYGLTFQQSGSLPAGLVLITGPWTSGSSDTASASSPTKSSSRSSQQRSTGSSRSTSAPRRSSAAAGSGGSGSCAAGTTASSTEDYPCRDNATGTGVYRDGTAGVHGLKPCPPGTVVPSDPDKPTRNASTGAVCGYVSGSG